MTQLDSRPTPRLSPGVLGIEALVRRAYEDLWNRGDVETLLSLADPGIVLQTRAAFPHLEAEYRGHDGIRRYWHTVSAPFEHLRIEVECVRRRGDDIAILFRFRAQGRGGWEMRARFGQVGHVREGLLTDIVAYGNWDSAAEAIGLRVEDLVR